MIGTSSPRCVCCASSFLVLTHSLCSAHRAAHQDAHPLSAPPARPPRASDTDKEREAVRVQAYDAERIASMRACRELATDLRDLLEVLSARARLSPAHTHLALMSLRRSRKPLQATTV